MAQLTISAFACAIALANGPSLAGAIHADQTRFDSTEWKRFNTQLGPNTTTPAIAYVRRAASGALENAIVAEGPESSNLCLGFPEEYARDPGEWRARMYEPGGAASKWGSASVSLPPRAFAEILGRDALLIDFTQQSPDGGAVMVSYMACRNGRELAGVGTAARPSDARRIAEQVLREAVRIQNAR